VCPLLCPKLSIGNVLEFFCVYVIFCLSGVSSFVRCALLVYCVYCVLFNSGVLFCAMRVICVLCLIIAPLAPGRNLFAIQINSDINSNIKWAEALNLSAHIPLNHNIKATVYRI
jgi:hypothetical protein